MGSREGWAELDDDLNGDLANLGVNGDLSIQVVFEVIRDRYVG